jgi:RNA polymerase-binding transcription factor DksA
MATAKKAAKKSATKKAAKKAVKKAPAKKAVKKAPAKKAPAKNAPAKKAAVKKAVKKAPAKKAPVKKAAAKKAPVKKTPAKKAVKKAKSPFGKKFIGEMKARLEEERAKYLHSEETYRAEADALIEGREPGDVQFDEESGEGDTLAVERERDLALSNQARQAVEQIDAALDRIKAGTYGICVASGKSIPQERLRAIPWAAERVEYKVGGLGNRL